MAKAFNTTLLISGFNSAEKYLRAEAQAKRPRGNFGESLLWEPVAKNEPGYAWQEQFLHDTDTVWHDLRHLIGHKTFAHIDAKKVNQWFGRLPNIPIRFEERPVDPDLFYVGTYFALRDLSWREESETWDYANQRQWEIHGNPAYRLNVGKNGVRFYDAGFGTSRPLVVIPTSNPRITIYAIKSSMIEEFDLLNRMQVFRSFVSNHEIDQYSGVVLPNVLVEQDVPIGEGRLIGMNTISYLGERVKLFDAGMFLRLVLCPEGPLAEGAAKMGFAKEAMMVSNDKRPNYVLDTDFHFAFVDKKTLSVPYIAAWVPASEFSKTEINLAQFN